jgi:hypothetical protein
MAVELNDLLLRRLLQQIVVGTTGLPGTMVRPRWQLEPPNQPDIEKDWAAIGSISRTRDVFPAVIHSTNPDNFYDSSSTVNRNQILEVLCSFYGPNCEQNTELFTMGIYLDQNQEQLTDNGFALIEVRDSLVVPALIKERWVMGIDTSFRLRRQQNYVYPVPNIAAARATLETSESDGDFELIVVVNPGYGEGLGGYGIQPYNAGGVP